MALVAFTALCWLETCLMVYSRPANPTAQADRILAFPADESVGKVIQLDKNFHVINRHLSGKPYKDCIGAAKVPANLTLLLVANDTFTKHANILLKMPADSFAAATFEHTAIADQQMAAIGHLTGLRYLDLDGTETSDAGMAELAGLEDLEYLDLAHTLIKGACLVKFGGMKKLQYIDLSANDINCRYVASLASLPLLRELHIAKSGLRDQDLAIVAKLPGLTNLSLTDNHNITDNGLKKLITCKHLNWLDVRGTAVSGKGVLALTGLPITELKLGAAKISAADIKTIKVVFPGISLLLDNRADVIPREVFAPLH